MSVHDRFRTERERLRLTQPEVAECVAVGKTTVINWEKGTSSPTAAQLAVLAGKGMDVLYITTGRYAGGVEPAPTLSAEEQTLLEYFRAASKEVRRAALGALIGGAARSAGVRDINLKNTAAGGVQVGLQTGGKVVVRRKGE